MLDESDNVRKGKFEPAQRTLLFEALPEYLTDFADFANEAGSRSGEIKSLQWSFLQTESIVVPPEYCKNRKPRIIALTPRMEEILERRKAAKVEGCPFIFHNEGEQIGDYRKAWATACVSIGLAKWYCRDCRDSEGHYISALDANKKCERCGKQWSSRDLPKYIGALMHDFRRTCAHELEKAGVPREIGREITGHKTESMYVRYADLFSDEERKARQLEAQKQRIQWKNTQVKPVENSEIALTARIQ